MAALAFGLLAACSSPEEKVAKAKVKLSEAYQECTVLYELLGQDREAWLCRAALCLFLVYLASGLH